MYNRYVPQPDGSFRRNRIPSAGPTPQHPRPCPPPVKVPEVTPEVPCRPPQDCQRCRPRPKPSQNYPKKDQPAGAFLKNLLPKDLDISDLIIVLLLLLMAGDCQEERNNALLTLALYFLM